MRALRLLLFPYPYQTLIRSSFVPNTPTKFKGWQAAWRSHSRGAAPLSKGHLVHA
jgi:hypothetical protein